MGASLATTLTKLALRYSQAVKNSRAEDADKKVNRFTAESMLVLTSIVHLGKSGLPTKPITADDADRICFCLKVLAEQTPAINVIFEVSIICFCVPFLSYTSCISLALAKTMGVGQRVCCIIVTSPKLQMTLSLSFIGGMSFGFGRHAGGSGHPRD